MHSCVSSKKNYFTKKTITKHFLFGICRKIEISVSKQKITMPVNIQNVLVCDAVDESCIQLLKQNGIKVIYSLIAWDLFIVASPNTHTKTCFPLDSLKALGFFFSSARLYNFYKEKKNNLINQPVFLIQKSSSGCRTWNVLECDFFPLARMYSTSCLRLARAFESALFACVFIHVHRFYFA